MLKVMEINIGGFSLRDTDKECVAKITDLDTDTCKIEHISYEELKTLKKFIDVVLYNEKKRRKKK